MDLGRLGWMRLGIGVAQGIALYLLYAALQAKAWPATEPFLFAPLQLIALFVPAIVIVGLGTLPPRSLAVFASAAAILMCGLAVYDVYRFWPSQFQPRFATTFLFGRTGASPSHLLVTSIALALFISFGLMAARSTGDPEQKYPRHFDVAWKLGLQLVLALLFLVVFWLLLWLGAALFNLVRIDLFLKLIAKPWFSIPASAIVFALAMHITDVQAGLVRGTRTLVLTLWSWLLPLMAVIVVAFLLTLPFTGLEPLWATRRAAALLTTTAIVLIFLINAAYQDGRPDAPLHPALRYARLLAAIALVPLLAIAGYALMLRVGQHGWSPQRIFGAAVILVSAAYAVGYVLAAARDGASLKGIETTNFVVAYGILAVLLALLTPIADPYRISVENQLRRLDAGLVSPEAFDYNLLRFRTGQFGMAALKDLAERKEGVGAAVIAEKAAASLRTTYPTARPRAPAVAATPQTRARNIAAYPTGETLPDSFINQDWAADSSADWDRRPPPCLTADKKCDAILVDLDGDAQAEIVLTPTPSGSTVVYKETEAGKWAALGSLTNTRCPGVADALRSGSFRVAQPPLNEIEVNGERVRIGGGCVNKRGAAARNPEVQIKRAP